MKIIENFELYMLCYEDLGVEGFGGKIWILDMLDGGVGVRIWRS